MRARWLGLTLAGLLLAGCQRAPAPAQLAAAMMRLSAVSPKAALAPSTGQTPVLTAAEEQAVRSAGLSVANFAFGVQQMQRDAAYRSAVGAAMMARMRDELPAAKDKPGPR